MDLQHLLRSGTSSLARPAGRLSCGVSLARGFLGMGLAFFTLAGWVRLIYSITNGYWLNFAHVRPGPLYLAVTGGLWGVTGLIALFWMGTARSWFRLVVMSVVLFFALTYWADRWLVEIPPVSGSNTVFALVLTLFCLVYVFLALQPLTDLRALIHSR